MKGKLRGFGSLTVALFIIALECTAQEPISRVARQYKPYTRNIALEFSKKERNAMLRALSWFVDFGPNGHATGFLVGDGLVMTSYHVVSGKLSPSNMKLLGFKPDDELQVQAYVDGCEARVIKVDREADLALLRVCTSRKAQRPTFRTTPRQDDQLLVIAQPGAEKTIREGSFNGVLTFRGREYWSVKVEAQDGFSGSPVYSRDGEIFGVFCLYDWKRGVALLSPGAKAQKFLEDYDASPQSQP